MFETRIEKFRENEWKEEKGHYFIILQFDPDTYSPIEFIKQLACRLKTGKVVLRIFPDGKGYIQ